MGCDFEFEVRSAIVWSRREVVASSYRRDRVFLLGDAAHQLSPTGGFGLNTGIGDVTNLAWKLAAVIDGWGGPSCLSSYETERRPIGRAERARRDRPLAATTKRWAARRGRRSWRAAPKASACARRSAQALQRILDRANCGYDYGPRYEDAGMQLGYSYENSPVDRARRNAAAAQRSPHVLSDRAARAFARRTSGSTSARRSSISSAAASSCCA